MPKEQLLALDLAKEDAAKPIVPYPPLLSSHKAEWNGIHVEYHCQPNMIGAFT